MKRQFLLLEDDPIRRGSIVRSLHDFGYTITVASVSDMKQELNRCVYYDAIFLDCDLRRVEDGDGIKAAQLLNKEKDHSNVVIHSNNSAGAATMFDLLKEGRNCFRIPYGVEGLWIQDVARALGWIEKPNNS